MRNVPAARPSRALAVCLLVAMGALLRPSVMVAQDAAMRWDGSIERVSSTADFGWPDDTGAARMSRQPVSADGRWVVFTIDVPNGTSTPSKQAFKRDRLFGGVQALFGESAVAPPVISADGNHIALEMCDGVWRSDGAAICDVFVLNQVYGMLVNASTAPDGTESDAASTDPVFSRDGRFVVFRTSSTTLLPAGAAPGQLVLRDRDADGNGVFDEFGGVAIHLVSVSSSGETANAPSASAQVSADGRFVAFRSAATNLVSNDTNGAWDVFLHDRETGETQRINVGWDGQEATPTIDSPAISMSDDGSLIAFAADDWYLMNPVAANNDTNDALDVLVYDRHAGTLQRIDVGVNGTNGTGHTHWPTFSGDGRYVSLLSTATNTEEPPAVTSGRAHAYVYDRLTAQVTRITKTLDGREPNADAAFPALSADGSFVLFTSRATNLPPSPASGLDAIYGVGHLHASPDAITIPGGGGIATIDVSAQQYVPWSVELSDFTWLSVTPSLWGTGPGSFTVIAYANPDSVTRSVSIHLGAQTILVTQEPGLSLASVSPSSGPAAGGTFVTMTGTGFEPDMRVYVGGVLTPFHLISPTQMTALTPAHAAGEVQISAETADGRYALLDAAFVYLAPPPITLTWETPASVVYGTQLDATQLNATASVAGTFDYSPGAGTLLPAGSHALSVTFTPDDRTYSPATATVLLEVQKATPSVVATGGRFTYDGQPHEASASATGVGGVELAPTTITYDGSSAAPVTAGSYMVVASYPGDANYNPATASATVVIDKAVPVVTVTGGTFIYDGNSHTANGTVTGAVGESLGPLSFTYDGSALPPVNAGTYDVVAAFAGDANHHAATGSGVVTIEKATPTVAAAGGAFSYDGTPHGAHVSASGVMGEALAPVRVLYNGSLDLPVNAGSYAVLATFEGSANYRPASASATITINKAVPVIEWPQPAGIVYGTALGAAQLNATASIDGTFTYSPAAGVVLAAGPAQPLFVVFTPNDAANYTIASVFTIIDVNPAPLEVRADDASKRFGTPLPAFTATITGFVNADSQASLSGALVMSTPATAHSAPGTYPIVPSGVSSSNYTITFVNGTLTIFRGPAE